MAYKTKEMLEFKSQLMSEVAKYIPEGMRDNKVVRDEFMSVAMEGIHRVMLTREEYQFVMKTKLYNHMRYARSAWTKSPKSDRDWDIVNDADKKNYATWYEEQGGDARLDELEEEYEDMDQDEFSDPKDLVLSLDYHLLGLFEPDHPSFRNGVNFDFIIDVDEVSLNDIEYITDCRHLVLNYSHLFWTSQKQEDPRPSSETKRSRAIATKREQTLKEVSQASEGIEANGTLQSKEEITNLKDMLSSVKEERAKFNARIALLEKNGFIF
jgi:hypothetical protein